MSRKKTIKRNAPEDSPPCPAKAELTEQEKARVDRYKERCAIAPLKFKKLDGYPQLVVVDPAKDKELLKVKLSETFGTADSQLQAHLTNQVSEAFEGVLSSGHCDLDHAATATSHATAIMAGIQPRDELEALLAVQMIGIHNMSMSCMRRAMLSDQDPIARQNNINMATKLTRTYIAQMQALKQYREGGQQQMTVKHVNVNDGGQAVVGVVNQGGAKENENRG